MRASFLIYVDKLATDLVDLRDGAMSLLREKTTGLEKKII
jgi:hypothetical protein